MAHQAALYKFLRKLIVRIWGLIKSLYRHIKYYAVVGGKYFKIFIRFMIITSSWVIGLFIIQGGILALGFATIVPRDYWLRAIIGAFCTWGLIYQVWHDAKKRGEANNVVVVSILLVVIISLLVTGYYWYSF